MRKVSSVARIGVAMAALTVPLGATAATVDADLFANQNFSDGFDLHPGQSQQYNFSVKEDLVIEAFAVSGTDPDGGDDLSDVTFGLVNPPDDSFDSVETEMGVSGANDFVPGATFSAGDMFSFYFEDGIDTGVGLTLAFDTESPAPIPVPAGGVLLLSGLVGGAAIARRKKRQS